MGSVKMTDEKCARCTRKLAEGNTNPERLCGYCQRAVDPDNWRALGRPKINYPEAANVARKPRSHKDRKLPDPASLPVKYLIECNKELKLRAARMAQDAKLLAPFIGKE